jgi:hypothetical protein
MPTRPVTVTATVNETDVPPLRLTIGTNTENSEVQLTCGRIRDFCDADHILLANQWIYCMRY